MEEAEEVESVPIPISDLRHGDVELGSMNLEIRVRGVVAHPTVRCDRFNLS